MLIRVSISLGVKWPGHEADHSPPSSAEVRECVELYFYSLNTPSWRGAQLKKAQGQLYLRLMSFCHAYKSLHALTQNMITYVHSRAHSSILNVRRYIGFCVLWVFSFPADKYLKYCNQFLLRPYLFTIYRHRVVLCHSPLRAA